MKGARLLMLTSHQDHAQPTQSPQPLQLVRIPGEQGPILRCRGALTIGSAELLRRELDLLTQLEHPSLTLNLAACRIEDPEGVLTLLDAARGLLSSGRRLVVVAGEGPTRILLQRLALDEILPVFPTEQIAQRALRGGGAAERYGGSWEDARAATEARWENLLGYFEQFPPEAVMTALSSMQPICAYAETHWPAPHDAETRCRHCPLFLALGGGPDDLGCRSLQLPLFTALQRGNHTNTRRLLREAIELIRTLPEPDNGPQHNSPETPGASEGNR